MVTLRKRGEAIRQFILDNVEHHPKDIAGFTSSAFGITRQAVNKHIKILLEQNALQQSGITRNKHYLLYPLEEWEQIYKLDGALEEHVVWTDDIAPRLGSLPNNVLDIWHYGFTEILNNAIDHSSGSVVSVRLKKTATFSEISIYDDGEGIFMKIQRAMGLSDERHAVLELSKGKLTTDPDNHTGEGIFFSSRMFDDLRSFQEMCFFRISMMKWKIGYFKADGCKMAQVYL